ncbi:murein hydrolase activator EnvC family protein [Candidatus Latescibacterota bacterium]
MSRFNFPFIQTLIVPYRIHFIHIMVLSALFLYPGAAISQQDEFSARIKLIETEIEKSEKELERGTEKLKKLKNQEQKIISDLTLQNKNIENISKNLIKIEREDKSLKQNSRVAQRNYDAAMKSFASRSDVFAERIRSIYKSQKVSPLELLFSSDSMSSVLRNFKMFTILAKNDIEVLQEFRDKSQKLNVTLNKLKSALNANISLARIKKNEQTSLANSKEKQQRILNDIKKNEKLIEEANRKHEENKRMAQAELNRLIRGLEKDRKQGVAVTQPSLDGYNFADHKGNLIWPVNGKVVSRFGTTVDLKSKTRTNNRGIEIETKNGEPVSAVGDGIVAMTQFIRGYGNFVLLSHPSTPNDYYSLYGHLSSILVNNGQVVRAGEPVGLAGSTGMIDNSSSRLVLEILKGETPVNPLSWLKSGNQRASR